MRALIHVLMLLLALPMLLSAWVIYNGLRGDEDSYAGLPRSASLELRPWQPDWFHVIDPPGFVLGYSERLRNPLWVGYRLQQRRDGRIGSRPKHFTTDTRTLLRVQSDAYRNSGFDRGHLAPNYAMARFHGRDAQLASFRMSNIVPQQQALNQKLWQRLEELEADIYARDGVNLWVLVGPLFDAAPQRLASGVAIPEAFFRIWLRERSDAQPEVLAFIVPQQVSGHEPLDRFLVTVDAIEARSGLDFFHQLPDAQERALESSVVAAAWDLAHHARRPPRY